jgi:hypothetical protein
MSVQEVIAEIEALPKRERSLVVDYILKQEEAAVPESFRRGMTDALSGRGVDMETALREVPPSRR